MDEKKNVNKVIELIARLSIDRSSQVFSKMVKAGARIVLDRVYVADISQVTENMEKSNTECIGALIDLEGDAPFKFLVMIDAKDVLILTDLFLQREIGTAKEHDVYTMSCVQEVGNILASAITNVFAHDFQMNLKPTPPQVLFDYQGTIFSEYLMNVGSKSNEVFIIESQFSIVNHNINCGMFITPLDGSLNTLSYLTNVT